MFLVFSSVSFFFFFFLCKRKKRKKGGKLFKRTRWNLHFFLYKNSNEEDVEIRSTNAHSTAKINLMESKIFNTIRDSNCNRYFVENFRIYLFEEQENKWNNRVLKFLLF